MSFIPFLLDRFLLGASGLRDAELARRLGVNRSTVGRAKRGETVLSVTARERLRRSLDASGECEREADAIARLVEATIARKDVRTAMVALSQAMLQERATIVSSAEEHRSTWGPE